MFPARPCAAALSAQKCGGPASALSRLSPVLEECFDTRDSRITPGPAKALS